MVYGSDCHGDRDGSYPDFRMRAWVYLEQAGFRDGDFHELNEKDLW